MYQLSVAPEQAPDEPEYVEIDFEKGAPRKINGHAMGAIELLTTLNQIGAKHGVGRVDLVENRIGRDEIARRVRNTRRHDSC